MVRWLTALVLLCYASVAAADPILLLLLRFARDRAVSASLEAGMTSLQQQYSTIPSPRYGFALATPPVAAGQEEQQMRTLLDENFLHLSQGQRNEVFSEMQKILRDPKNARDIGQLVAEFSIAARGVRESYRGLEQLSESQKKSLVSQAKEEYRQLPDAERRQLLEVLQSGSLPVPRDLRDSMLAEFGNIAPMGAATARP
jgi:hypothetical protein